MDVERSLIAKAVHTCGYDRLMSAGIEPSHFEAAELRDVWVFITQHIRHYHSAPSYDAVKKQFPKINLEVSTDSLDYLVDEFKKVASRQAARRVFEDIATQWKDPGVDYESLFFDAARKVAQTSPGGDFGRFSDMNQRIALYNAQKQIGTTPGIMYGIPDFDNATLGIQPHEFITIAGFTGAGKSTLLQYFLMQAYLQGKRVLVFNMELDKDALFRRWEVMAMGFAYQQMKQMKLSDDEVKAWEAYAVKVEEARDNGADILVIDRKHGACTVDKVYAEIIRHAPDVVGIDYLTLMGVGGELGKNASHWEKTQFLTRELKAVALGHRVPIIAAAQSGREASKVGARLDNVGSSISIVQDSDVSFGLDQTQYDPANKRMTVKLLKNRDGFPCDADLLWDLAKMRIGPWDDSYAFTHPITDEAVNYDPTL